MPVAFWIAHVEVTDPERYADYAKIASEVIPAHGGEFIARGGRYRVMEGAVRARHVVARFPSFDAAVACYESPDYARALEISGDSSKREVIIVEGV